MLNQGTASEASAATPVLNPLHTLDPADNEISIDPGLPDKMRSGWHVKPYSSGLSEMAERTLMSPFAIVTR